MDIIGNNPGLARLVDSAGLPFGVLQKDGCITFRTYLQAISEGDVTDHLPWVKLGYSPASTTSRTLLWSPGTDYVYPAAAQEMTIVSANAQDTSNGTGIQKMRVYYLDGNYAEKIVTVTMNGATPVSIANDIFRINFTIADTVGTGGASAGVISIKNTAGTVIYDQMAAGQTFARTLLYTVPLGKTLHVTNLLLSARATSTGKGVTFTSRGTYDFLKRTQTTGRFMLPYTELSVIDNGVPVDLNMPSKFPEKTDLMITVMGEAGAVCACMARGWVETN